MKVEPIGFGYRVNMGCERKRRVEDDANLFGLSSSKDEVAIN